MALSLLSGEWLAGVRGLSLPGVDVGVGMVSSAMEATVWDACDMCTTGDACDMRAVLLLRGDAADEGDCGAGDTAAADVSLAGVLLACITARNLALPSNDS